MAVSEMSFGDNLFSYMTPIRRFISWQFLTLLFNMVVTSFTIYVLPFKREIGHNAYNKPIGRP